MRVRGPITRGLGCMLVAVQLVGCALTTAHLDLAYTPEANVAKVDRASSVAVRVDVVDVRAQRDRVSSKKNGYGMEMAPFIANNDVVQVVREAVQSELRNRGFGLSPGAAVVRVELQKFYTEAQIGFWSGAAAGDVVMNVQVLGRDGALLYSRIIEGQNSVTGLQIMSEDDVQKSLDGALRDALSKLMQDPAFVASLFKTTAV